MTDEVRPDGLSLWPVAPEWLPAAMAPDYAWFLNVFVHDLNLLRFLLGVEPRIGAVDFERPNGRVVTFDCGGFPAILELTESTALDWHEGAEIVFERGRLALELPPPMQRDVPARVALTRGTGAAATTVSRLPPSWSFRRQAEAFVTDIREQRDPIASGRDSVGDVRLAEAIWRRHATRA
jgi:predicted dehydrogenase